MEQKIIFLLMPLKQEIESHRLHRLHTDTAVCDNSKNFDVFKNKFQDDSIKILIFIKLLILMTKDSMNQEIHIGTI